jgi:SAM-dependent methyltransferase
MASTANPKGSGATSGGSMVPQAPDLTAAVRQYMAGGSHSRRYLLAKRVATGRTVLDFGCGHGFGRLLLGAGPARYRGVDSDDAAVAWARGKIEPLFGAGTRFLSPEGVAADGDRFEVVIAFEVIEHVRDPAGLLANLRRWLAPGGRLLLSTPNGFFFDPHHKNPFHVREYTWRELDAMVRESGLSARYLKERRIDGLDVVGRKLFGARLMGDHRSETTSVAPPARGPLSAALRVYRDHLDGPRAWRIYPAAGDQLDVPDYSTIVADCRADGASAPPLRGRALCASGRR